MSAHINRRDFLRMASLTSAGLALASCAPSATPTSAPNVAPTSVPTSAPTAAPTSAPAAIDTPTTGPKTLRKLNSRLLMDGGHMRPRLPLNALKKNLHQ